MNLAAIPTEVLVRELAARSTGASTDIDWGLVEVALSEYVSGIKLSASSVMKNRIYVIRPGEQDYIKVGFSVVSAARIECLQTGNPVKLNCIGTIDGSLTIEAKIHKNLEPYKAVGEWFHYTPTVQKVVQSLFAYCRFKRDESHKKDINEILKSYPREFAAFMVNKKLREMQGDVLREVAAA